MLRLGEGEKSCFKIEVKLALIVRGDAIVGGAFALSALGSCAFFERTALAATPLGVCKHLAIRVLGVHAGPGLFHGPDLAIYGSRCVSTGGVAPSGNLS